MADYVYTLFDEEFEETDFDILGSTPMGDAKKEAITFMEEHDMPVGILERYNMNTHKSTHIDIVL